MSDQKISPAERLAFLEVHGGKCFYTGVLLDASNFHIEHIIPERLAAKPAELKELLAKLELPSTFDIFGYENLAPVSSTANLRKGDDLFEESTLRYFLALAAKKKDAIATRVAAIEARNNGARLLYLLSNALQAGKIEVRDISDVLDKYANAPEEVFQLIEKMAFADSTEVEVIRKADIEDLRNRPVQLGANTHIQGLTLDHETLGQRHVRTCREYDDAIAQGFYARTSYAMKMEVFFRHQSGLLRALSKANFPARSYIDSPRVGLSDWQLLPFDLFPRMGDKASEKHPGVTYQDKVSDGTLSVTASRHNSIRVVGLGMGQQIVEVARADFTGDGLEDILVFEYAWATGGTLGFGGVSILSRKSAAGPFDVARLGDLA